MVVWDFKGEEGNSHEDGKQRFGKQMFSGSCRDNGGFPGSEGRACDSEDLGSICGSGRSPGEGNGNPLQCSCLANLMDRGAWWATVHEVAKSRTRLSD